MREGHKRIILQIPTGGGKTVCACMVIQPAVEMGKRVIFLAHARELIYQCRNKLADFGIQAGIIMAGEPYEPWRKVQVASKDTINARAFRSKSITLPDADIVFADECHRSLSPTWARVIKHYHKAVVIGLTATPARGDGRGMGELYTALVQACPTERLIEEGYLAPSQVYAPYRPDLSKVRTTAGEYNEGDLDRVMNKQEIVGNIVEHWISKAKGRPTIVFCTGIEHSIRTRDAFVQHGIRACHVDGETPKEERDELFKRFLDGDFSVLTNCDVCLDSETEILTSDGWVNSNQMTTDMLVANWDQGEVYFDYPIRVVKKTVYPGEAMSYLNTTRRSVRVTGDHKIVYRTLRSGRWLKAEASNINGKDIEIPVSGQCKPFVFHINHEYRKDGLTRIDPQGLSIEQCTLVGFWTGDGSAAKLKSGGIEYKLHQATSYQSINEWIKELLAKCNLDYIARISDSKNLTSYSIPRGTGNGSQKRRGVYSIEPYLSKERYGFLWGFNENQFDAFVYGLHMAEGLHGDSTAMPETVFITSACENLVDTLQAVGSCRGWRVSSRPTAMRYSCFGNVLTNPKQQYRVSMKKTNVHKVTKKYSFQPQIITEPETVWCVEVQSGCIITRRNGSVTIVGNCSEGVDLPLTSCVVLARPTKSIVKYKQQVGRGMRPCEGKNDLLVLDHAGSVYAHGFPEEDVEWTLDSDIKVGDRVRQAMERGERKVPTVCKKCFLAYYKVGQCPNCGYKPPGHTRTKLKTKDGDLVKLEKGKSRTSLTKEDMQRYWTFCLYCCAAKNKTVGNAAGMFKSQFKLLPWTAGVQPMPRSGQWAMRVGDLFPKYNKAK